jgi:hypothetical protein
MIFSSYWLRRQISLGFFIWLAAMLFAWMPAIHQHVSAQEPPTLEQVRQAVQKLGADSFQQREEASLFLWQAGRVAEKSLVEAAASSDGEIAFRAQAILEKIRYGIFPDTPPDVIALIEMYRQGNISQKHQVLAKLNQNKQFHTILTLLRSESDQEQKQALARNVINENNAGVVTILLVEGDFDQLEDLLKASASFDKYGSRIRDYATLLLLTGKLDANIEQLQQEIEDDANSATSKQQQLVLAHFYAMKGDYEKAKSLIASEKKYDAGYFLLADLHYRMQNWSALVEMAPGDQGLENLGFSAAYNRLAGNREGYEQAIAALKQLAIEQPDETFMCGEALMINHCWQETIDLNIKAQNNLIAFRILCEQSRYEEAFALIELDVSGNNALAWWQKMAAQLDDLFADTRQHFALGLLVAKTLHALGEHEQAIALLNELAKVPVDEKGYRQRALVATEMELGMRDVAFEHADKALQVPETRNAVFYSLFQAQAPIAQTLYDSFQWHKSAVSAKDLYNLIRPEKNGLLPEAQLRQYVKQVETWVNQMPSGEDPFGPFKNKAKALEAMGNLALIHRHDVIAHECFEKQQSADPNSTRFADQLAQEKNWQAAAVEYERAWQYDQANPLALFLSGHALVNSGRVDEGTQKMQFAKLLPIGNTALRRELADGLNERGMIDAATEQWELILKIGLLGSWEGSQAWAVGDAAANIARQNLQSDPLRAAWLLERQVFYLLKTNSAFNGVEHYARHMHLVHKARALGLLRENRIEEALDEIELSLNARIDQVDSTIEFVLALESHALENHDLDMEAQQVFDKTADRFKEIVRLFPRSSHHHNNLAWLMASCNRELDQALVHATQANQLSPDNTNFIDTLAEVHFRMGQHAKAIELMQTALQLEPDSANLQKQLQRFQKAQAAIEQEHNFEPR